MAVDGISDPRNLHSRPHAFRQSKSRIVAAAFGHAEARLGIYACAQNLGRRNHRRSCQGAYQSFRKTSDKSNVWQIANFNRLRSIITWRVRSFRHVRGVCCSALPPGRIAERCANYQWTFRLFNPQTLSPASAHLYNIARAVLPFVIPLALLATIH